MPSVMVPPIYFYVCILTFGKIPDIFLCAGLHSHLYIYTPTHILAAFLCICLYLCICWFAYWPMSCAYSRARAHMHACMQARQARRHEGTDR